VTRILFQGTTSMLCGLSVSASVFHPSAFGGEWFEPIEAALRGPVTA
jgi:hypothetical protein